MCPQTFLNSSALLVSLHDGFALTLGTKTRFGLVFTICLNLKINFVSKELP